MKPQLINQILLIWIISTLHLRLVEGLRCHHSLWIDTAKKGKIVFAVGNIIPKGFNLYSRCEKLFSAMPEEVEFFRKISKRHLDYDDMVIFSTGRVGDPEASSWSQTHYHQRRRKTQDGQNGSGAGAQMDRDTKVSVYQSEENTH